MPAFKDVTPPARDTISIRVGKLNVPDRPDLLKIRARLRGKTGDKEGQAADEARAAALEKKR